MSGKVRVALASVLALLGFGMAVAATTDASTDADFTGSWSLIDHVTAGPQQGNDYPWQGTWTQSGSHLTGTGGYTIDGTVSGSTATFVTTSGGSYVATFILTMSDDGKSLSGTATDNGGRSFSVTGTGNGKPATTDTTTSTATSNTTTTPANTTTTDTTPAPPKLPPLPAIDPAKATGRVQAVKGSDFTVIRDGKRYSASKNTNLQVGDTIETGKNTIVAVEFLIGGRVGINELAQVTLTGDRNTDSRSTGPRKVTVTKGAMWVNESDRDHSGTYNGLPYYPLEITTNGGVAGIRG